VGWEKSGRVEPSGIAVDFWNRYEDLLDRAAALGWEMTSVWLSPESSKLFASWTVRAVDRLADRCRLWITFNEVGILAQLCYAFGMHPPSGENRQVFPGC
jgi:beta-glucosidase/6-phospho-beta-glucosidase/beta-galactosidase